MKNKLVSFLSLFIAMSLSGCSVVGGIFKAGAWTGIVITAIVVAIIVGIIFAVSKK
jgi:hypothetical protein